MTKKKSIPIYKHWWFPILSASIILPAAGGLVAMITQALAAPQEIKSVKEAVIQNSNTQAQLTTMVQQQKEKNDQQDSELIKQKEVSQLQIDSLKQLLAVMKK